MSKECKLCGRRTDAHEELCEICKFTVCRKCGVRLAKGYCAICGELVCDEDSKMVGYARVCNECLTKDQNLLDYTYLKSKVQSLSRLNPDITNNLRKIFSVNGYLDEKDFYYVFIGLDDTDSPFGMCTTYLAGKIIEKLDKKVEFLDYPYLVRLNPNIPFKTRGNASVRIGIRVQSSELKLVIETIKSIFTKYTHSFFKKTSGVLAFYISHDMNPDKALNLIYTKAITDILTPRLAKEELKKMEKGLLEVYSLTTRENGLIGATAAIGAKFDIYTFELLTYRKKENIGKPRGIDLKSVLEMDRKYNLWTFNNIDGKRMLIAPTGPDPVLYGIRGYDPKKLLDAMKMIKSEEIDFWVIFKSNQGTNAHIIDIRDPSGARPYQTVRIRSIFERYEKADDKTIMITHSKEWRLKTYIYRPQTHLRELPTKLVEGDEIEIIANVQRRGIKELELNLEEIHIVELKPTIEYRNPLCPKCGVRMKSKGKEGYKCKNCGYKLKTKNKLIVIAERNDLEICKRYLPPPKAQRHLTKPQNFDETKILLYKTPPTPIWGKI